MNGETKKYKEIEYFGILITHSKVEWCVLMDKPIDRQEWMNDHERMFLVCQPYGEPERIIVSGYTLRVDARGKIPVIMSEQEQEAQEEKPIDISTLSMGLINAKANLT